MTQRQIELWLTPEAEDQLDAGAVPEGESLMPDDVARMVLWLASDDSRMCTASCGSSTAAGCSGYSAIDSPEPPNSVGKSFSFGRPSRIGSTVSA